MHGGETISFSLWDHGPRTFQGFSLNNQASASPRLIILGKPLRTSVNKLDIVSLSCISYYIYTHPFIHLSTYSHIHLSICLPVHLSFYLPSCLPDMCCILAVFRNSGDLLDYQFRCFD